MAETLRPSIWQAPLNQNLIMFAVIGAIIVIFCWWLNRRNDEEEEEEDTIVESVDIPWSARFQEAEATIKELIATLPPEIRKEAERLPLILEKWPPPDRGADLMGEYHGFEESVVSSSAGPIFIYIGPHYEHCAFEQTDFAEEIRRTYLHELGHHLGLEESDLDDRGIG